jgi:HPt (histidine-containing phosphotransfer) domain-containing protein
MEEMPRTAGSSLGRHPWQSELIARIKDPLCINNKTPVIAIVNPEEGSQEAAQSPLGEFDGSLIKPITEEQLNKIINLWQTKALAYIQIILSKTKNNQRLALTIAEKLFEELPLQIIAIKNALENKHYDLAQEITHKLNGSVSFCGLMEIQQPAKALESCLLNNHYAAMNQHFSSLQQHTLNFTRHQESILTGLGEMQLP